MGKDIYFPNLNGLRFLAALSVIVSHFYGSELLAGHFGVILFFALSGFLITYLLLEEKERTDNVSIKKFYIRRILRIWPLYFIIIILAPLVAFLTNSNEFNFPNYLKALPFFLFFMPNIAYAIGIKIGFIDILWSIGSEEQFYLFWPWIIKYSPRKILLIIFAAIIAFFLITPYTLSFLNNVAYTNNKYLYYITKIIYRMGFNSMATGAVFAFLYKFKPNSLKLIYSPQVQFFTFAAIIIFWILKINLPAPDQIYAILFSIVIVNLATNNKSIFSLENNFFNYLGKISYGLYVYHVLSFYIYKLLFGNLKIFNHLLFIIGLILTIGISSFSYYFIEKKFLQIKQIKYSLLKTGKD